MIFLNGNIKIETSKIDNTRYISIRDINDEESPLVLNDEEIDDLIFSLKEYKESLE